MVIFPLVLSNTKSEMPCKIRWLPDVLPGRLAFHCTPMALSLGSMIMSPVIDGVSVKDADVVVCALLLLLLFGLLVDCCGRPNDAAAVEKKEFA